MPKALFKRSSANNAPIKYSNFPDYSNTLSYNNGGPTETNLRTYTKSGTVHGIVSLLANDVARVEWRLYRKNTDSRVRYSTADTGSDQRTEVLQHQALKVLNAPNPFMTRMELFALSQTYLELTGESWWIINYVGSIPTEIWPVSPVRMTPIPSPDNFISGYVYTGPNGEQVPFKVNEIVISKTANPLDIYRGQSPITSVMADVEAGNYAAQYNRNFFYNDASPGGIIETPNELTDEELDQFTNRWRETHRGMSRAHRVAILEAGMTWVESKTNARDMDFVNLDKNSRDKIREAYRVHPIMLGITDDVNRANAQTGEEVHANTQTIPRLDRWQDVLNNKYLLLFGSTGQNVEFGYVQPIPSNREQDNEELTAKVNGAVALVNAGYDPHDALEVVGLPDMAVVEKATQTPAMPPGWVAAPPAGAPTPGAQPQEGNDGQTS